MTPFPLVLSSPSGAGKSTIAKHLLDGRDDLGYSISATTRPPRADEEDGVHYHFLSPEEFEDRIAQGAFLEWATYGGERYGTLRHEVDRCLGEGKHVVLDVEVEGARRVRARFPAAVLVFILPPSSAVLLERLTGRKTEDPEALARRLAHASQELGCAIEYDYVVVNDDVVQAVDRVAAILDAESVRVSRRPKLLEFTGALRHDIEAITLAQRADQAAREG